MKLRLKKETFNYITISTSTDLEKVIEDHIAIHLELYDTNYHKK